ncbi:hypothetical protein PGH42_07485 [Legionella pneumophila]|nr:hypothetical protein PGH42_07485 [Legionella pneumophila]
MPKCNDYHVYQLLPFVVTNHQIILALLIKIWQRKKHTLCEQGKARICCSLLQNNSKIIQQEKLIYLLLTINILLIKRKHYSHLEVTFAYPKNMIEKQNHNQEVKNDKQ